MEYSSSEDDELIDHYVDLEDDIPISDVDQRSNEVTVPLHFLEHGENSMAAVSNTIGSDLLSTDGDVKNIDPYLNMEFESDSAARAFYHAYALRLGFGIRVARSRRERRKGVEVLVMKRFVCLKEGHHKKKVTDHTPKKKRKRLSIRDGCPAMMEVVRRGPDKWVVTKLVLDHTHIVVSPERIREIQYNRLTGKEREHDTYLREMRQKVFGDGDAQGILEYLRKAQAANSGFFYSMQVDSRNCITNVFWADIRARLAYNYFGDAVTFDTSYKKNEKMLPFATFTGVNHHGQPVNFGCALVIDDTPSSYAWLFETWLSAMFNRQPLSFTTDQGNSIGVVIAKVFPNTRHRLCKWNILSRCKKKLSDVYSTYPTLHDDLKKCVIECETIEAFEAYWRLIVDKYNLRENAWLQSLYNIRHKWIPAYLKGSFFAEFSATQRLESMNRFYRNHFDTQISLQAFIDKFDQAIDERYEKEEKDNFALYSRHILKTSSPMEKQAAELYTKTAFEKFQLELLEAFNHYVVKIQEGAISKYSVDKNGNGRNRHFVAFNASEKKAVCSCFKFEVSGILCRHILGVLLLNGGISIPEHYILRRWTRKAKTGIGSDDRSSEVRNYSQTSSMARYSELFNDAIKFAEKGSTSPESYKIAKEMLQKAFAEIVGLEESVINADTNIGRN
ncbi:protein FAR1-RELATED SEQUENCE 5-like [Asparagus officinalis]|uniref:protein FAR1-RELATED SEQUENCE 5-like n=1 Tax=Asparagus officinalis TaxID=4686 RepID=UPI00098E1566|nr:protein FAR1-RELATED SEQUENCE 5-like [Asparagus officinalis]